MAKKTKTRLLTVVNNMSGAQFQVHEEGGKWKSPATGKEWPEALMKKYSVLSEQDITEVTPEVQKHMDGVAQSEKSEE